MIQPRSNKSRWLILGVIALFFVVVVVFVVRMVRMEYRHHDRTNRMKHVGMGIHRYWQAKGIFPSAVNTDESGKPLSSWRYSIYPYLPENDQISKTNVPWNDSASQTVANISCYAFCWSPKGKSPENLTTNVMAITGPDTMFDEERTVSYSDTDTRDTVVAISVSNSGIHWTEPGDIDIRDVPDSITQGIDGEGVYVLFADGSVILLRPNVPLDDLRKFFTIEGAKKYDSEKVLGPYYWNK